MLGDFREIALVGQWDVIIADIWVSGGVEQKMGLLYNEVLPLWASLRLVHPKAKLFFHGFVSCCDEIWDMSPETKQVLHLLAR